MCACNLTAQTCSNTNHVFPIALPLGFWKIYVQQFCTANCACEPSQDLFKWLVFIYNYKKTIQLNIYASTKSCWFCIQTKSSPLPQLSNIKWILTETYTPFIFYLATSVGCQLWQAFKSFVPFSTLHKTRISRQLVKGKVWDVQCSSSPTSWEQYQNCNKNIV